MRRGGGSCSGITSSGDLLAWTEVLTPLEAGGGGGVSEGCLLLPLPVVPRQ